MNKDDRLKAFQQKHKFIIILLGTLGYALLITASFLLQMGQLRIVFILGYFNALMSFWFETNSDLGRLGGAMTITGGCIVVFLLGCFLL